MIKFFRKIRMSLLSDGKFGKYLLYAAGEIVLVVIGILIALSLNNTNQKKQERQRELKMLGEIKSELLATIEDLADDKEDHQRNLASCEIICENLINRAGYHDSLLLHFFLTSDREAYNPKTSAYQSLKSTGIDLISNDSLRIEITSIYELVIADMANEFGRLNEHILEMSKRLEPHWEVDTSKFGKAVFPIRFTNYPRLLEDDAFLVALVTHLPSRHGQIQAHEEWMEMLEETILHIEEERGKG